MPFYTELRRKQKHEWARRTAKNLLGIRKALRAGPQRVPAKIADRFLTIGTWNIRDFDSNKYKCGPRTRESLFYIAEIINAFDIVALQEVNRSIGPLKDVLRILGPNWEYIVSDITEGSGGNGERMAFVWDKRKVQFRNVIGEVVLPGKEVQFARTPFLAAFQSGWFKFNLCAVHIYYGANYGAKLEKRTKEIEKIGAFFKKRAKKEKESFILLGDFNIKHPEHGTMKALTKSGFFAPKKLQKKTTLTNNYYDQIAFLKEDPQLVLGDIFDDAGVIQIFDLAYSDAEFKTYKDQVKPEKGYENSEPFSPKKKDYQKWRTWQLSDHYPLWARLKVDFTDEYLEAIAGDE